ncbi:hypothetical protein SCP_0806340 [Sparassis crispa]|uniref:Uncharacterized protein n=1 Tax=Sparassis crispa TaxID=139825 RepID=A0A401GV99_9APHY|nr:hypothetical protein SCP_0806340 [Sparassis crispa]GBE86110.1 hypothetical protein SCP_0806340 [Sparassis crispa]
MRGGGRCRAELSPGFGQLRVRRSFFSLSVLKKNDGEVTTVSRSLVTRCGCVVPSQLSTPLLHFAAATHEDDDVVVKHST